MLAYDVILARGTRSRSPLQAEYNLAVTWRFNAPVANVWKMLNRAEQWPQWWKDCRSVEVLAPNGPDGVGCRQRFTMQTRLPYCVQFDLRSTRAEPCCLLEGIVDGCLRGKVRWDLTDEGQTTKLQTIWEVRLTNPWAARLSPVMRPVFVWDQRTVMRNGGRGLARMMAATLIEEQYR
jgi:uncharacterized protein YndB with AHSA1/START domain